MAAASRTTSSVESAGLGTTWGPSIAMTSVAGDKFIVARVGLPSIGSPHCDSVTWNGVALTRRVLLVNSTSRIEIWDLANPDIGSYNLVASMASDELIYGAFAGTFLTGAVALGNTQTASGTGLSPTLDISSATGRIVLDSMSHNGYANNTAGAGQTLEYNEGDAGQYAAGSSEPGAATVTMSWSIASGSQPWALGAV